MLADLRQASGVSPDFRGSQFRYHWCTAKSVTGYLDTVHRLMQNVHTVSKNGSVPFFRFKLAGEKPFLLALSTWSTQQTHFPNLLDFLAPDLENIRVPITSHRYKIWFNFLITSTFYYYLLLRCACRWHMNGQFKPRPTGRYSGANFPPPVCVTKLVRINECMYCEFL
jgi:hypothetical protein